MAPPLATRYAPPPLRPGSVTRERLLSSLGGAPGGSLILITGQAGSGKTTLLAQWAERLPRAAYLRVDASDADAARLLAGIASALSRVQRLPRGLVRQFNRPADSLETALLPRLVEALWADTDPIVLMLDEVEALRGTESLDALAWLAASLPARVRLALASRVVPDIPVERLGLEGRVVEIGPDDLALSPSEILALAEVMGTPLSTEDAARIAARTEGWAAAVRIALELPDPTSITGDSARVASYIREQLLDRLEPADRARLQRLAVLEVVNGPLGDAVLGMTGSLRWIREVERSNPLVAALDHRRTRFQLHPLLREVLVDELEAQDPAVLRDLRRRAAVAADALGEIEAAAEYAMASGDLGLHESLVARRAVRLFWRGRLTTVSRWIEPFDRDGVRERSAAVAVLGAWFQALEGRTEAAERWLAIADRSTDERPMPDGAANKAPWIAALRSLMMPAGASQARIDVAVASAGLPRHGYLRHHAEIGGALVALCDGDLPAAARLANSAAAIAEAWRATPGQLAALGIAAAVATERRQADRASAILWRGLRVMEQASLDHYSASALLIATAARRAASIGEQERGQALLARFDRLRPFLGTAFPSFTVLSQLQAIRARLACNDLAGARVLFQEASEVLEVRPGMGWLADGVAEAGRALEGASARRNEGWGLTTAELRVLALLPTYLSIREIARRLGRSPHTVKTQVVSLYGKMGASTRAEAIELAIDAGLLEPSVLYRAPLDASAGTDRAAGQQAQEPPPDA